MSDHEIRVLMRRYRESGEHQDFVALLGAQLRVDQLSRANLELAARFRCHAALELLGWQESTGGVRETIDGLSRIHSDLCVRAAIGAAHSARSLREPRAAAFESLLGSAEEWLSAPPASRSPCRTFEIRTGTAAGHEHAVTRPGPRPLTATGEEPRHWHRALPRKGRTTVDHDHAHSLEPDVAWTLLGNAVARVTDAGGVAAEEFAVLAVDLAGEVADDADAVWRNTCARVVAWALGEPYTAPPSERSLAPISLEVLRTNADGNPVAFFERLSAEHWKETPSPLLEEFRLRRVEELEAERSDLFDSLQGGEELEVWREVCLAIDLWHERPFSTGDGCSAQELFLAEVRCESMLPRVLRAWYLLVGARLSGSVQDPFVGPYGVCPNEWRGEGNRVRVLLENQGNWNYFIKRADLTLDDPPVYFEIPDYMEDCFEHCDSEGLLLASRLSEFLRLMVSKQIAEGAAFGTDGPFGALSAGVRGTQSSRRADEVMGSYPSLPVPAALREASLLNLAGDGETILAYTGWAAFVATRTDSAWKQIQELGEEVGGWD